MVASTVSTRTKLVKKRRRHARRASDAATTRQPGLGDLQQRAGNRALAGALRVPGRSISMAIAGTRTTLGQAQFRAIQQASFRDADAAVAQWRAHLRWRVERQQRWISETYGAEAVANVRLLGVASPPPARLWLSADRPLVDSLESVARGDVRSAQRKIADFEGLYNALQRRWNRYLTTAIGPGERDLATIRVTPVLSFGGVDALASAFAVEADASGATATTPSMTAASALEVARIEHTATVEWGRFVRAGCVLGPALTGLMLSLCSGRLIEGSLRDGFVDGFRTAFDHHRLVERVGASTADHILSRPEVLGALLGDALTGLPPDRLAANIRTGLAGKRGGGKLDFQLAQAIATCFADGDVASRLVDLSANYAVRLGQSGS